MKKNTNSNILLFAIIGCLVITLLMAFHFFQNMNSKQILLADVSHPRYYVLYNYKLLLNKKAVIYCLTVSFVLLQGLLLILVPSKEQLKKKQEVPAPHIPEVKNALELQNAMKTETRAPVMIMKTEADIAEDKREQQTEEEQKASMVSQLPSERAKRPKRLKDIPNVKKIVSTPVILEVQEELRSLAANPAQVKTIDEHDVVFGAGKITDHSIVHFIYQFPNSVVKFLYQQAINGTPISADEKRLYEEWYDRGLIYNKLLAYLLTIIDWDTLPNKMPYEVLPLIKEELVLL